MNRDQNAIIIGCGIAGTTLALSLEKIGVKSTIYEAESSSPSFGILSLTANGLQVLKFLDIFEDKDNINEEAKIFFYDDKGKTKFSMAFGKFLMDTFGSGMIILRREELINFLIKKVESKRIPIQFEKKLVHVKETEDKVTAYFEDGTSAEADFLVGCDGMKSKTRKTVFPKSNSPIYSGYVAVATELPKGTKHDFSDYAFHMTFGKQTFSGSIVDNNGHRTWWSYLPFPESSLKTELKKVSNSEWTKKLYQIHKDDPKIQEFISLSKEDYIPIPLYDLPHLETWHSEKVCLIGDAAHGTSPHIGQGAAISMEDAVVLAKCIRDIQNLDESFEKFEQLRKPRAEKIVKEAQNTGKFVLMKNPVKRRFSKILLSLTLSASAFKKRQNWIFSYKIDWDEKIKF